MTPVIWIDDGLAGPALPDVAGASSPAGRDESVPAASDVPGDSLGEAAPGDEPFGGIPVSGDASPGRERGAMEGLLESLDGVVESAGDVRGEDALSGFMMAMGVGIIIMVLLRRLRRRAKLRPKVGEPKERIEEIRGDAERRAKKEQIASDLEELARHFAAVMDNKAARLEILIEQADRAAARFEGHGIGAGHDTPERRPEPSARGEHELGPDRGFHPASGNDHDGVYGLADEGLGPVEIAQRLGKPVGEVELILALRAG